MRLVKMNFNIENQAISVLNDTPYSVYNQNTESIPLWTGRSTMPRINLASAETLFNRIAKVDPTLIKDIGKDNLILNLNEHTDRMYNKVSRSAKGEYIDEILESLNFVDLFINSITYKRNVEDILLILLEIDKLLLYLLLQLL